MPDVRWSSFYYAEILAALRAMKRQEWPAHTETDPSDPVEAFLRLEAGRGHLQATRLDHAARELLLPTAQLRSSLAALAALVGYQLDPTSPADVDIVADLVGTLGSTTTLLAAGSLAATASGTETYEYLGDALAAGATGAWTLLQDDGGSVTELSLPTGSLWGGTATANDALYLLHAELQWTSVSVSVSGAHTAVTAVRWEYYDDLRSGQADAVTDLGSTIRLGVASVVGATRADGLSVTVTCLATGSQETCTVSWVSSANVVVTSGLLGQSVVSTSAADYRIETSWPELPGLVDGTSALSASGTVSWTLPQTTDRRWAPTTVGTETGYAIRCRLVTVTSGAEPGLAALSGGGTWSLSWSATQGRTLVESLGTSDATAGQTFDLRSSPFIALTSLTVGGDTWARAGSFLEAGPTDRVFVLTELADGTWRVSFGDGVRGAVPASLAAIVATYRVGGASSGNCDALAITRDRTGNGRLSNLRNPRAASGWAAAEGSTPAGLELLRLAIPASVRSRDVVVTPDDAVAEATTFRTADNAQVAERAFALEAGAGPASLALVCVGPGGTAPTSARLEELDEHLNGVLVGVQRVGGVAVAGLTVTPSAATLQAVDVTATVSVLTDYSVGAVARIKAAVEAVLRPLAKRLILGSDGVWAESDVYLWDLGGTVARAVLTAAIVTAQSGVTNVTIATPASDLTLGTRSLPKPGTVSITVVAV